MSGKQVGHLIKVQYIKVLRVVTMSHSNSGKQKERRKTNCHQCRRNDRAPVVYCSKCRKKQYCVLCIKNRYPTLMDASFAEACPACLGICNCADCQKYNVINVAITTAAIPEAQDVEGGIMCDVIQIDELCKIERYLKQRTDELGHTLPVHHAKTLWVSGIGSISKE